MSSAASGFSVLVVDDEDYVRHSVVAALKSAGIANVAAAGEPIEAMELLATLDVGLVLLDLTMPGMPGEQLLARIREDQPGASVVVVTGNRDVEKAVECMRAGAADYLIKPVERERLIATVRRIIENQELLRENEEIKERLLSASAQRNPAFSAIATADPRMLQLMSYAEAIAKSAHPVLVTGETGVGKELFSRAVHELSGRKGELVAINAAGLDDALFADLLFGHRKGAYTGADSDLEGLIDKARNGTLFLDEIGDLSPASQLKLLRVIETGEYFPLGSDLMRRGRARFIVATNRDLDAGVSSSHFRRDLYYRLRAHRIRIPRAARASGGPTPPRRALHSLGGRGAGQEAADRAAGALFPAPWLRLPRQRPGAAVTGFRGGQRDSLGQAASLLLPRCHRRGQGRGVRRRRGR